MMGIIGVLSVCVWWACTSSVWVGLKDVVVLLVEMAVISKLALVMKLDRARNSGAGVGDRWIASRFVVVIVAVVMFGMSTPDFRVVLVARSRAFRCCRYVRW